MANETTEDLATKPEAVDIGKRAEELLRLWCAHDKGNSSFYGVVGSAYTRAQVGSGYWGRIRVTPYPTLNFEFRLFGKELKLWSYESVDHDDVKTPTLVAQTIIDERKKQEKEMFERYASRYHNKTPIALKRRPLSESQFNMCIAYLDERLMIIQKTVALFEDATRFVHSSSYQKNNIKSWIRELAPERKATERLRNKLFVRQAL